MSLVSFPILILVFAVGLSSLALAAGGGGGAGGSGAQNQPASGLPPGEPGPPGAVNNRHGVAQATSHAATEPAKSAPPPAR